MIIDQLLSEPQYHLPQVEKEARLLPEFIELTKFHVEHCPPYARIIQLMSPGFRQAKNLGDLPYLPVGLFKTHDLKSVPEKNVSVRLTSSGTSGSRLSRVAIDDQTSKRQAKALASIMSSITGGQRLPMLLIESEDILDNRKSISAQCAGILGMMTVGRSHCFVLDSRMELIEHRLKEFLERHHSKPFLVFGFTFVIWQYFYQLLKKRKINLSNGIVIHGGGWKKLEAQSVDNAAFRKSMNGDFGITKIYNFYGMAEQMGTVCLEGDDGLLHPPAFSDIIIRNSETWEVQPPGKEGVIQMLSLLPLSYPGHSILTEDRGVIVNTDAKHGLLGKALRIIGRIPAAELRGCSDAHLSGN